MRYDWFRCLVSPAVDVAICKEPRAALAQGVVCESLSMFLAAGVGLHSSSGDRNCRPGKAALEGFSSSTVQSFAVRKHTHSDTLVLGAENKCTHDHLTSRFLPFCGFAICFYPPFAYLCASFTRFSNAPTQATVSTDMIKQSQQSAFKTNGSRRSKTPNLPDKEHGESAAAFENSSTAFNIITVAGGYNAGRSPKP